MWTNSLRKPCAFYSLNTFSNQGCVRRHVLDASGETAQAFVFQDNQVHRQLILLHRLRVKKTTLPTSPSTLPPKTPLFLITLK